ncbi:MAG: hypothetical protein JOY82_11975 [Streptosporangiaceae bacterium]|nr:hypothetical protein [Streptosporangiaceae bacterium]MBV9855216.1 hypothetical protein [Streptosporangiaceae bacterium]
MHVKAVTTLAALPVALAAALAFAARPALAAGGFTSVPAPPAGQNAVLGGVTSTSDTDAWAVGSSNAAPNGLGARPVIDHWNGSAWSRVASPSTGYSTNSLSAVSASSTTDAWAVGRSEPVRYTFYPLGMHWNGTAWSTSPGLATALAGQLGAGVADISPTDAYAIGGHLGSAHTGLVAHWNGTSWTRLMVPQPSNNNLASDLDAISADGPSDVWIAGRYMLEVTPSDFAEETYTLHWDGTSWSIVPMPLEPGTNPNFLFTIYSIKANSPTDVWAVGAAANAAAFGSSTTLIEHFDGKRWSIVPSPSPGTNDVLTGVTTSNAANSVWAVGYYTPAGATQAQTLALHWDGTAWTTVPSADNGSPSVLASASTTPGASTVWAVGYTGVNNGSFNPLVLRNG